MNRIFNQQLKINKYLIVGIFLLTPILSVQKITAGVLYIDQMLTSGKIGNECVSYFPVKINSEGANTNSADIKINFDPTKAQLHDFDSNKPGIQVQNGNVYVELPYNISDNTLGEIKVTGYRLNSFNGDNVFFYVYFKPLQFNTPIDFEIEFTDVGNTYDSNIAETSTSVDLLTSVENRSFTLYNNECEEDQPLPIPPTEPVPGVEEPKPTEPGAPISTPVNPDPSEPGVIIPRESVEDLAVNWYIVIPFGVVLFSLLTVGTIAGNPLIFTIIFLASYLFRRKIWGILFIEGTQSAISFAKVQLFKVQDGTQKLISTTISDEKGRYGFNLNQVGDYIVKVIIENTNAAQRKIKITDASEVILDISLKENFEKHDKLMNFKIALIELFRRLLNFLRIISIVVMLIGTYLTLKFVEQYPSLLGLVVLSVYLILVEIQIFALVIPFLRKRKLQVIDKNTNTPIKGAIVRLKRTNKNALIKSDVSITNQNGIADVRISQECDYQIVKAGYEIETGLFSVKRKLNKLRLKRIE